MHPFPNRSNALCVLWVVDDIRNQFACFAYVIFLKSAGRDCRRSEPYAAGLIGLIGVRRNGVSVGVDVSGFQGVLILFATKTAVTEHVHQKNVGVCERSEE